MEKLSTILLLLIYLFLIISIISFISRKLKEEKNITESNDNKTLKNILGCKKYEAIECYFFILKEEFQTHYEIDLLIKKLQNQFNYENKKFLIYLIDLTIQYRNFLNLSDDQIKLFNFQNNSLIRYDIENYNSFINKYLTISHLLSESIKQQELLHKNDNITTDEFIDLFYSRQISSNELESFSGNKEFEKAIELFNNNQSFFLSGAAGTGKSSFVKYITENTNKKFVLLAPTGVAALNINGQTIHSFFDFDPNIELIPYESNDIPKLELNKREFIKNIDFIIIDEASMVRVDMMDAIDYSLRINGGNKNLPFGGKQIILVGDVFQLGPIFKPSKHFQLFNYWTNIYFFNSHAFQKSEFNIIELKTNYRQIDDDGFIKLLDKIKLKEITNDQIQDLNRGRIFTDINQVNDKIILTTSNNNAKNLNNLCLQKIKGDPKSYKAIINEFPKFNYPTDEILDLKVGAQIIFIKNDRFRKWVNGTMGKIIELNEESISVKLKDGETVIVNPHTFEYFEFIYNQNTRKTEKLQKGTFIQFPIKLAWAITIHKSQGLTFDEVIIDVSSGTFSSGQLYVALSRARKLKGVYFLAPINLNHIRIDTEILNFYREKILVN